MKTPGNLGLSSSLQEHNKLTKMKLYETVTSEVASVPSEATHMDVRGSMESAWHNERGIMKSA